MSAKFEVGDIVTGKQSATEKYSVTIRGAILEVVEAWADMIRVRVIGCDDIIASDSIRRAYNDRNPSGQIEMIRRDANVGSAFSVQSEYFELTARVTAEDMSRLNDFLDCM